MARASRIVSKPKKKTVRAIRRGVNRFALMPTDSWFKAKHYVHYEIESAEWITQVKNYIRNNFDAKIIANVNRLPDWKVGHGSHWATTAALLEKNPEIVPIEYSNGIVEFVKKLAAEGESLKTVTANKEKVKVSYTPTIQERIQLQVEESLEGIEEWLELFLKDKENFDPKGFDFTAHFAKYKITQAHARKIIKIYQSEFEEAKSIATAMPTPQAIAKIKDEKEKDLAQQFREGYKHLTKKDAQNYLSALETLVGACMLVVDTSKATRKPRAKKAPSKDKIVSKLKFKATDEKYQLASVNPLELIQSTEIWVFNTKTRKLGKYVAASDAGVMTVKGSALIGYDEEKSVQKTLRKPEESLKEFKAAGKIKLRRFLEEIKTTDTKLSGRINEDTIILKALQ